MARDDRRSVTITAVASIALLSAGQLWLAFHRALNVDEFEHAHATWCLSQGLVPYRDFFEHHTPWLYFLFAPLFARSTAARDPDAARQLLLALRLAMWTMTAAAVALTWKLGRLWHDRTTGVVAAFLLASSIQFLDVTLEFRPDVPALVCWLVSLVCAMRAWRTERVSVASAWFAASGLAFSAALLFTQKYVFVVPGLVVMFIGYVIDRRRSGIGHARRIAIVAVFVVAVCVPFVATMWWFAARGASSAFVYYNLDVNVRANANRFSPLPLLVSNLVHSPALMVLGTVGFWACLSAIRVQHPNDRLVLVGPAASLVAGLVVFGRVYGQYLVMFFPLLAVFAAAAAPSVVGRMSQGFARRLRPILPLVPVAAACALLIGLDRPTSPAGMIMLASFTASAALGVLAIWYASTARGVRAAAVALAAFTAMTAGNAARIFRPMTPQIADLAYVITHTRPDDSFLGSGVAAGAGTFRPHAWFYFFSPVFATEREIANLVERITSGQLRPRIIAFEESEGGPPDGLREYLRAHYAKVGESMYERLPDAP